jgi:hypothetical protein
MYSSTLWKDRRAENTQLETTAQTTPALALDWRQNYEMNSSACSQQAAQLRVETIYARAPLMLLLARDRQVFDVPPEERLQPQTSEQLAWAKTMLPVISQNIRDTRAQLHTGQQDIRTYFSKAAVVTMIHRAAAPTVPSPARPNVLHLKDGHVFLKHPRALS